ncbi:MAG: hypothetical protein ABIO39_00990 [Caulobacteraceae bacterium]
MRTAEDCRVKAADLTKAAEGCPDRELRKQILETAEAWCELATSAAWQDGNRKNKT